MRWTSIGLLSAGLACSDGSSEPADDTQISTDPGPLTHQFSFAIIADPHIAGPEDHEARLETAVTWINEQAESKDIQLVLVLGDAPPIPIPRPKVVLLGHPSPCS